jgi:hypothetical protein
MRLFDEYWPERLYVYEPEGVYEELGVNPPSVTPKAEFQDKWSSYGVMQDAHFGELVLKNGAGRKKTSITEQEHDLQGSRPPKSRTRF